MGVTDVPQWLPSAFVRSVLAVGATAPREQIEEACSRLLARWQEPERHFHNLKHLVDVLARVDELAAETHHPDVVRLAAWYHGAVFSSTARKAYSRSGGEDEVASAELATADLRSLGVPEKVIARVTELIHRLKRHEADPRDIDSLALCDADLAVLAADPQHYRAYRRAVRAEYEHLPARHYVEARKAIVTKLLARRHLFVSPMGAQWEDIARENLRAELERLEAELADMGDALPGDSVTEAEAAAAEQAAAEGTPALSHADAGRAAAAPAPPAGQAPRTSGQMFAPTGAVVLPPEREPAGASADSAAAAALGTSPPADGAVEEPRAVPARSSSLESLPDELDPLAVRVRGVDDGARAERQQVAQSSRELVEHAVREGRARAERERDQRERLEAVRAERERDQRERLEAVRAERDEAIAAFRARRQGRSAPSAPTPTEPEEPDRLATIPLTGIEREPELFGRPRRKGDKKRR
ncbi:hypothetical protein [Georgenia sp. AZ-5]|uniref:HD domain-containing protein n=1 Tax=Georgenia sp. AZ-5 TaxID=3367526 RepID=UPI00375491BE